MAVWDLENAAHLLRRVGFGGTPQQIQEFHDRHTGVSDAVDELLNFRPSGRKPPGPNDVTDGDHTPPYATPNENFGRELQELFTLGRSQLADDGTFDPTRPNYTESDVHNMARACTGWTSIQGKVGVWNQGDWDGGQYDDNADGVADPMVIYRNSSNNFRIDDGVAGSSDDVLTLIFGK